VFFGLIIWSRQVAFLLIFCGFAASGFLRWFYYRVIHKNQPVIGETGAAADIDL
jgi:formate-dependent nitrite reductase membrane component NrfD